MSESQVAATDSALRMQAGAWICCTLPWLPVDTVTTAPLATSASTATARLCVHAVLASQWPGKVSSLPRLRFTAATSGWWVARSEEHTSELQSLMRISYAVFCLKKNKKQQQTHTR